MKTWIFAGVCDKSELLFYISKLMSSAGSKVLLVDATEKQKYPLIIGQLDKPLSITEFSGFDVACGFENYEELTALLDEGEITDHSYDYVIYDVDMPGFCPSFVWEEADRRVWVSDYEIWTLEKGMQWIEHDLGVRQDNLNKLEFHRVFVRAMDEWFDESYMDAYFERVPVIWVYDPVFIFWNELDAALKLKNEHSRKLLMKPLTRMYKKNLLLLIGLLTDMDSKHIRRALRSAERRRA